MSRAAELCKQIINIVQELEEANPEAPAEMLILIAVENVIGEIGAIPTLNYSLTAVEIDRDKVMFSVDSELGLECNLSGYYDNEEEE